MWPGIEGYNYPFQTPYAESWARFIDGVEETARALDAHGRKLFLEHKNSEPAMKIFMRNIGMCLHVDPHAARPRRHERADQHGLAAPAHERRAPARVRGAARRRGPARPSAREFRLGHVRRRQHGRDDGVHGDARARARAAPRRLRRATASGSASTSTRTPRTRSARSSARCASGSSSTRSRSASTATRCAGAARQGRGRGLRARLRGARSAAREAPGRPRRRDVVGQGRQARRGRDGARRSPRSRTRCRRRSRAGASRTRTTGGAARRASSPSSTARAPRASA